eukprot:Nk52_evm2s2209 gene=Nk52_evmTU2s2209
MPVTGRRKSIVPYPEFEEFDIYLTDSVFYDNESVSGFARVVVKNMMLNCVQDVVIECLCDHVIYSETGARHRDNLFVGLQRGGAPFETGGIPGGEYEIPFTFDLPEDLPASMKSSNRRYGGFYHEVKYQIRAYIVHAQIETFPRAHVRTSMPFHRRYTREMVNVEAAPTVTGKKSFLFKSSKPLSMTVELGSSVFEKGSPIDVKVTISNHSDKTIKSLCISSKQVVKSSILHSGSQGRKNKVLKENINLEKPIKSGETATNTFQVEPTRLESSAVVTPENKTALCPSASVKSKNGSAEISYYLKVHCNVSFGSDLVVKVPFTVCEAKRENVEEEGVPPTYRSVSQTQDELLECDMIAKLSFAQGKGREEPALELPEYREVVQTPRKYSIISACSIDDPLFESSRRFSSMESMQSALSNLAYVDEGCTNSNSSSDSDEINDDRQSEERRGSSARRFSFSNSLHPNDAYSLQNALTTNGSRSNSRRGSIPTIEEHNENLILNPETVTLPVPATTSV